MFDRNQMSPLPCRIITDESGLVKRVTCAFRQTMLNNFNAFSQPVRRLSQGDVAVNFFKLVRLDETRSQWERAIGNCSTDRSEILASSPNL